MLDFHWVESDDEYFIMKGDYYFLLSNLHWNYIRLEPQISNYPLWLYIITKLLSS